jgi:hypothetical protein
MGRPMVRMYASTGKMELAVPGLAGPLPASRSNHRSGYSTILNESSSKLLIPSDKECNGLRHMILY